jgi:hypothetical protein
MTSLEGRDDDCTQERGYVEAISGPVQAELWGPGFTGGTGSTGTRVLVPGLVLGPRVQTWVHAAPRCTSLGLVTSARTPRSVSSGLQP